MKIKYIRILLHTLIFLQFLYLTASKFNSEKNESINKQKHENIPKTKTHKKHLLGLSESFKNFNELSENQNENYSTEIITNPSNYLNNLINLNSEPKKENSTLRTFFLQNKIMAHRGLFGYFPEHSIKGFELAYYMGADYLETDINLTKDGKMVIFHDPILNVVTDIAEYPQFQSRKRNKTIDGISYENSFFISDFTYEELSQFYLLQRFKNRPQIYNKEFKILLIEDLINLVLALNTVHNKSTGIYIEPKNPLFFQEELNLSISEELFKLLDKYNLTSVSDAEKKIYFEKCPIVIQAFELETLKFFKAKANLPQIFLMTWRFFYNFTEAAQHADGFGPDINYLLYERVDDFLTANKTFYASKDDYMLNVVGKKFEDEVDLLGKIILPAKKNLFLEYAKKLNVVVHPYNMNNDNLKFSDKPEIQYCKMKKLGVHGFFADFCDTALISLKNAENLCAGL